MVTWGVVTILTFFVTAYWQIYALRFLLGVMEAGFFPGTIFYLSQWVPSQCRAKAVTLFSVGSQPPVRNSVERAQRQSPNLSITELRQNILDHTPGRGTTHETRGGNLQHAPRAGPGETCRHDPPATWRMRKSPGQIPFAKGSKIAAHSACDVIGKMSA